MLKDFEGNFINLKNVPNSHLLILGQSGSGKTYFSCRKIEEDVKRQKSVLILDYSGSYTRKELEKNRFGLMSLTNFREPRCRTLRWAYHGNDLEKVLPNVLVKILGIRSFYQKKLLKMASEILLEEYDRCNLAELMAVLERLLNRSEDVTEQENLKHLLARIEPFSDLQEFSVIQKRSSKSLATPRPIQIIQLSDYPEMQRRFLMNFFVELLWEEKRKGRGQVDILVLDEFQHLNLKTGFAVPTMLREGRKFGMTIYLSSQFIGEMSSEEIETILQAGKKIFFHPTENGLRKIASWIEPIKTADWERILNNLSVGQAVVKGKYSLGERKQMCSTPIVCNVQEV